MISTKSVKLLFVPVAVLAVILGGCGGTGPTTSPFGAQAPSTSLQVESEAGALRQLSASINTTPSTASATPTPIRFGYGQVVGLDNTFSPTDGDSSSGGIGNSIDGVPCDNGSIPYHIHAHVSILVNGQRLAIPDAIGLYNPGTESQGMTYATICYYHLHTHDATGLIHIEGPVKTTFTLGQLFAVWGQTLSSTNIGVHNGTVKIFVATAPTPGYSQQTGTYSAYTGDPQQLQFASHQEIVLEVGPTFVYPPDLPAIIFPIYQ